MSNKVLSYIIKQDSVTVVFEDGPETMLSSSPSFTELIQAMKAKDSEKITNLMRPAVAIKNFTQGDISIVGNSITYKGEQLSNYVVNKIFEFMSADLPWEHLVSFLDRLMQNPSMRAREELYRFLETENLPVTEDGHFLAYKRVRHDFKDWHSNSIDNSVGKIVEMPRFKVDDNQAAGCSAGLHAGSLAYINGFHSNDGVVVIVKIDPKDVVCIPNEDVRKLRCCKYEVISTFKTKLTDPTYTAKGDTFTNGSSNTEELDSDENYSEDDSVDSCSDSYDHMSEW